MNVTTVIAIGSRPPTTNTDCQPNAGIRAVATQPTTAAPIENPQNMIITADARLRFGMYSAVSAIVLGIAPPMPNPVISRNTTSEPSESPSVVSSEPTPKISGHRIRIGRRPKRSASGPNSIAPTSIPVSYTHLTLP